ncbi:MAG TPA: hypothetical protein VFG00_15760 [Acidothermaceae bacterium]|nr:hypothetical protein [Acidothermaceae bacterium]
MTDVEQLLRETLADPRHRLEVGPGMYDTVRERAHQRRRRVVQVASAFTAVVVIAGVATSIGVNSGHRRADQVAAPSITPSPQTGQATAVDLGKGSTSAMAVTSSSVFVARQQPNELVQVSTTNLSVAKRVATPDAVDDIAVDKAAGRVWTWSTTQAFVDDSGQSTGSDSTSIHAYATSNFAIDGAVTIPTYTFDAAALDGQLWLATNDGLYVVTTAANGDVATRVISGMVFSVATDAVRHRVLYGAQVSAPMGGANSLGSIVVHEIDAFSHAVIGVGSALPIGKESIAIVGDQIWVGGYGSGSTPRLFHLDGASLQTLPTTGVAALELGPGAIVWPGASVVWVRSGGSEGLACIDPQSGALLEQWDAVQGPVASVRGHAFASSDGSLKELSLAGDCTG